MTSDLLERTRFTTSNVLREAKLEWKDISRLLLVGGSSRMPQVHNMLRKQSGLEPDRSLAADEAVAQGAAIYAGFLLAGKQKSVHFSAIRDITNVSSHDLGVLGTEAATGRPRRRLIIRHNTRLPATKGGRFHTQTDDQHSVLVRVVEGGDDSGHNATTIGTCVIANLPPGLPAHTPIDVFFKYKANGRLMVLARLPDQDCQATTEIQRESGLSREELADWAARIAEGRLLPETVEAAVEVEQAEWTEPNEEVAEADLVEDDAVAEAQTFEFLLGDEESATDAEFAADEASSQASAFDDPGLDDFFRTLK
jgi:molecular chaperone DnaK